MRLQAVRMSLRQLRTYSGLPLSSSDKKSTIPMTAASGFLMSCAASADISRLNWSSAAACR